MMGWLARIAGPRVLLGVAGASAIAIGSLLWLMLDARDDAATAQAQNTQLRTTVSEQTKDHQRLRAELDRRDEAVAAAQREQQTIRNQSRAAINDLQKALQDDSCANRPHPDAVTNSLRFGASGTDEN